MSGNNILDSSVRESQESDGQASAEGASKDDPSVVGFACTLLTVFLALLSGVVVAVGPSESQALGLAVPAHAEARAVRFLERIYVFYVAPKPERLRASENGSQIVAVERRELDPLSRPVARRDRDSDARRRWRVDRGGRQFFRCALTDVSERRRGECLALVVHDKAQARSLLAVVQPIDLPVAQTKKSALGSSQGSLRHASAGHRGISGPAGFSQGAVHQVELPPIDARLRNADADQSEREQRNRDRDRSIPPLKRRLAATILLFLSGLYLIFRDPNGEWSPWRTYVGLTLIAGALLLNITLGLPSTWGW